MDSVKLNESPAKTHGRDQRAEDIRLKCLEMAVSGHGSSMNDVTVINRARQFEGYVTGTEVKTPSYRTEVLSPPQGGWRE